MARVACFLYVVAAIVYPAFSDKPMTAPALSQEEQAYRWFDELGFPPLRGCKVNDLGGNSLAYMLKDAQGNSYLFTGDFACIALDRPEATQSTTTQAAVQQSDKQPNGNQKTLSREIEMTSAAEMMLASQGKPKEREGFPVHYMRMDSDVAEAFVLARACAANGLDKQAHELFQMAAAMPDLHTGKAPPDFRKYLSEQIATNKIWRAIVACGNPDSSRAELLEMFRDFVRMFPESKYMEQAKDTARILTEMVREDEEHAQRPTTAPDKMTVQQRVAELIYQLRDQNGQQWSQPGECDIFCGDAERRCPASQLVTIGYDAVPQLIEALGDERLTRSVGFGRNFFFSHYVLRVGDCAQEIISRIAGRRFYERRSTSGAMLKDGQLNETRQKIEAWWSEFQKKGEKQMLIEGTSRGDGDAWAQAAQLVQKYPEVAAAALEQGIRNCKDARIRNFLVGYAGDLPGGDPVAILLYALYNDSSYQCRATAARELFRRGRKDGIPVLIELWNSSMASQPATMGGSIEQDAGEMVSFLMHCGSLEAITALAKDLRQRPIDLRLEVIESVTTEAFHMRDEASSKPTTTPSDLRKTKEIDMAIEELLVRELEDTESRNGLARAGADWNYVDPRLCDVSGYTLSHRFPQKYRFDPNTSEIDRDHQRVQLINSWRKEHGESLLPVAGPTTATATEHH